MNDRITEEIPGDSLPPDSRSDRRLIYPAAGLVFLTFVAAFVGGRLLNQKNDGIAEGESSYAMSGSSDGQQIRTFVMDDSDKLPRRPPESFGQVDHRENNSFFIRKPSNSGAGVNIIMDDEGNIQTNLGDGPIEEVVITRDTLIYRDRTMEKIEPSTKEGKIKPVLEAASADEIGEGNILSVWGRKQGDRIIAEVVTFISGIGRNGSK